MWNVRRLCSQILWMEDGQRARLRRGRRDRRALHERGQPAGARRTRAPSLQSHRGGTGEVRFETVELVRRRRRGRRRCSRSDDTLVVRGALHGVEAGRAPGLPGGDRRRRHRRGRDDGELGRPRCGGDGRGTRRDRDPVRAACRCGRASTCCGCRSPTRIQLASYDVVTAGPRFAVTGQGGGVDSLADEQDGLVTLPFEVVHRAGRAPAGSRT